MLKDKLRELRGDRSVVTISGLLGMSASGYKNYEKVKLLTQI